MQLFLTDAKNNLLSYGERCGAADSALELLSSISSSPMSYLSIADISEIANLKSEISSLKSKLVQLQKIDRSFNYDAEIKKIASEMKIELPLKEPSASLKDVDAEFKTYLQEKANEKYSVKAMFAEIREMEIDEKFKRYGPDVRRRKRTEQSSKFFQNKVKFIRELEVSEKPEYYRKYGYSISSDGTFKSSREIINEKIKKLKDVRQNEIREKEKSILDGAD